MIVCCMKYSQIPPKEKEAIYLLADEKGLYHLDKVIVWIIPSIQCHVLRSKQPDHIVVLQPAE